MCTTELNGEEKRILILKKIDKIINSLPSRSFGEINEMLIDLKKYIWEEQTLTNQKI